MNKETMNHFIGSGKATMDRSGQSTTGIVVSGPVIYETEILGEERLVLCWHGDRDNVQREFPLLITPKKFYETVAANILMSNVLNVGRLAEFKKRNIGEKSSHAVVYCDENLNKGTVLVGGIVFGVSFLFQVETLEIDSVVITPRSYFGDDSLLLSISPLVQ
ncbi:MAG: hypothetical protein ACWGHO_01600 [Candidatus Moraniibacteriota bacterium]